jgi:hypothetical protein
MSYEREDGTWLAWAFWGAVLVAGALLLFGVIGPSSTPTAKPDWHKANCYKIPARYHGGLYCSDEEAGGNHGYVNPGSMEWEIE